MPTVLLVETDQRKRIDLTSRIEATPSSTVLAAVSDLANACLEVEHRNPDILIIASDLAILPEFDTPSALFRGLSVKCVLSCWARVLPSKVEAVARRNKFPVLRADLSTGKLEEILKHVQRSCHINSNQKRQIPMSTTLSNKGLNFDPEMRVLIGASTGGVEAILDILSKFPCNCPPTFIVQHTGSRFVEGLVNLFNQVTEAQVCVATNREPVASGKIYIAPNGDKHLELAGNGGSIMRIVDGPAVSGHSPSVDRLFSSAVSFAPKISAALLTGMGSDGAKGLMKLRHAGAKTFAQDEESSIVYGMPRVAVELGAVEKQAHLSKIGDYLLDACRIDCKQV